MKSSPPQRPTRRPQLEWKHTSFQARAAFQVRSPAQPPNRVLVRKLVSAAAAAGMPGSLKYICRSKSGRPAWLGDKDKRSGGLGRRALGGGRTGGRARAANRRQKAPPPPLSLPAPTCRRQPPPYHSYDYCPQPAPLRSSSWREDKRARQRTPLCPTKGNSATSLPAIGSADCFAAIRTPMPMPMPNRIECAYSTRSPNPVVG